MERYICIHCHFYQPPRENPWLETIELQDSAYPYHDWNERISDECYAPNAAARILGADGKIERIVNNYSQISFNFGPTLLSWLESERPEIYDAIREADRESQRRFGGHGSALAQAYNHMILPLASRRDKSTQLLWGIRDFEHRFRRYPEGMWLPETAVDTETLELAAEMGIKFTVLAPRQAGSFRKLGEKEFSETNGENIDPTTAYLVNLPSGRKINVFFYDGPISRAVAFEGLLSSGERFAARLLEGYHEERTWPQLMHIATDGETYGHHHRFGEMALAYALHHIEQEKLAVITNYGEYLEKHPPQFEAKVVDDTSWSCIHGVERWRSDCGCNSGMHAGWNQQWRGPLRAALDELRDGLAAPYEDLAGKLLKDCWAARDDYVGIVLDRAEESRDAFLGRHQKRALEPADEVTVWKLLELERHAMLMYTSCGWFFDELSGIETVQVMQYAGRSIQLAQELFGDSFEQRFLEGLKAAHSNVPAHGDGVAIYEKFVRPAAIDLLKVGAHYAISSLFEGYGEQDRIYCYDVHRQDYRAVQAGRMKLAIGRAAVTSAITRESEDLSFGVIHFGDHNLNAGVRAFRSTTDYRKLMDRTVEAFYNNDLPEVIRLLGQEFEGITYSLRSLFRDEQRKVIQLILDTTLAEVESSYRQIYDHHAPLMRFLGDLGTPLPRVLGITGEFVLNANLRREFEQDEPDLERISGLLEAAGQEHIAVDSAGLAYTLTATMERLMERFAASPSDTFLMHRVQELVGLLSTLPFKINLFRVQNFYYRMLQTVYPEMRARSDAEARAWVGSFEALGEKLRIRTRLEAPKPAPSVA